MNYSFSFRTRLLRTKVPIHRVRRNGGIPVFGADVGLRDTNTFDNGVIISVHPVPGSLIIGTIGIATTVPEIRNTPVRVNYPRRVKVGGVRLPSCKSDIAVGDGRIPIF